MERDTIQTMSNLHPNVAGFAAEAAALYDSGRGAYPPEVIAACGLPEGGRILDLAAGTGLFSEALIDAGHEVIAVEPMPEMRERLAAKLGSENALEGVAEAIPLSDGSVVAATVADAFHWFDADLAAAELHRVLEPGGTLALIWRWPEEEGAAEWQVRVRTAITPHRGAHPGFVGEQGREGIERRGGFAPLTHRVVRFLHQTTAERHLAALRSYSFIARMEDSERDALIEEIAGLLPAGDLSIPTRANIWTTRRR